MFHLIDTFNKKHLSAHRTEEAADEAQIANQRAVRRANGTNSYVPTDIIEGKLDHEDVITSSNGRSYSIQEGHWF